MKIPKELNTVTSFSKVTAAILFIVIPFISFYIGMVYGRATYQAEKPDTYLYPHETTASPSATLEPSEAMKKTATPSPSMAPKTTPPGKTMQNKKAY